MIKGFDTSTPLNDQTAALFAADGYQVACRYLVPSGWKALGAAEAEIISRSGMNVLSVYETTANRALGGRSAGINDGYEAAKVAEKVGQPYGSCIYAAVDFEVSQAQMKTVMEYIKGFSEATPKYTTGVYGSYTVVDAAWKAQVCSRFWQTKAWSYGAQHPYANVYQCDCGPKGLGFQKHGIGIDDNYVYSNEGSWNTNIIPEEVKPEMNKEDANELIELLKAIYKLSPNPELGRLADVLRTASGQPTENN